uniref:Isochorismatase-like domain-containing protein n=1 Tax=Phytophthora ramorum TaxID=164328 RepID=H3HC30_PHYRM
MCSDLIFITTSGLVYSVGRYLTENAYDHVVVVLDENTVLHVGMPSVKLMPLERLLLPQRQPVVLRVPMPDEELQLFLRCARQLLGCRYDVARAYQLMLRLVLKRMTGSTPLPRLPLDVKSNAWICSDSIIVLLAGCCKGFREALAKARQETDLDIFTLGSASMTDFQRIRRVQPDIISRVPLPVVNYTLAPRQRSWRAYIPEAVRFAQSVQDGTLKWPLLAPELFPKVHDFAASIPPTSLSVKRKTQILGYIIVFLVLLRRGLTIMTNEAQAARAAATIPAGGLCLLVIDQQVDFHPGGSLAIPTANGDAARIAAFIRKHGSKLTQLVLTLDSHQRYHIAHGIFWENAEGKTPEPFTLITAKDVAAGTWRPRDASLKDYVLAYTTALEASGKFTLCIWPEHCLIGSPGHNIVPNVYAAALEWTKTSLKPVQYVMKGSNSFTEHYSALKAEFELPYDPATSLNQSLVDSLKLADKVVVCGEAISHCVNYTVRDLVSAWPKERLHDLVILTDCASPVPGFEKAGEEFLRDMATEGLTLTTSANFAA